MKQTQEKLNNLIDVLDYCLHQDYPTDVIGRWVWVSFKSKPDKETRADLTAVGFRWSKRRNAWAHNCGHPTRPARGYTPREKYGSIRADDRLLADIRAAV